MSDLIIVNSFPTYREWKRVIVNKGDLSRMELTTKKRKWRIVFALDCHGGFDVEAQDAEAARRIFDSAEKDFLFSNVQVKNIRYLGAMKKDTKTRKRIEEWKF